MHVAEDHQHASHTLKQNLKGNFFSLNLDEFWFSDGSLSDKSRFNDPGLMPLPDTATGLDWSHLVDAAQAFEGNEINLCNHCVKYN